MSQALANLHYEMDFFSPFIDQVECGLCVAIESATHLQGGWLCKDGDKSFIVSDRQYLYLESLFGECHEPVALIGLGRNRGIV